MPRHGLELAEHGAQPRGSPGPWLAGSMSGSPVQLLALLRRPDDLGQSANDVGAVVIDALVACRVAHVLVAARLTDVKVAEGVLKMAEARASVGRAVREGTHWPLGSDVLMH